jgi:VanZ family protein
MKPALVPYPPSVRRAALVIALLIAMGIAYLSMMSGPAVPAPDVSDKIRHFGAYAMLAIPTAMWFGPGRVATVIVLTVYGAGLEIAQALFTATREASMLDGLANTLGAAAGYLLVWFIARTRTQ